MSATETNYKAVSGPTEAFTMLTVQCTLYTYTFLTILLSEVLVESMNFANLAVVNPLFMSVVDTKWSNFLRFLTFLYFTRMLMMNPCCACKMHEIDQLFMSKIFDYSTSWISYKSHA